VPKKAACDAWPEALAILADVQHADADKFRATLAGLTGVAS
jgi:hypothetical protein